MASTNNVLTSGNIVPIVKLIVAKTFKKWTRFNGNRNFGTTKNSIFYYRTPCSPLKVNRRFGGTCRFYLKGLRTSQAETSVEQVAITARLTLVSCLAIFSTLQMEMICISETSVNFQRTTRRCIPEDRSLHNYRCENLKSFMTVFTKTLYLSVLRSIRSAVWKSVIKYSQLDM
jgi:hypothetical protein